MSGLYQYLYFLVRLSSAFSPEHALFLQGRLEDGDIASFTSEALL